MRINFLKVVQVKESAVNYPAVENRIRTPQDIVNILRHVVRLHEEANERFGIVNLNTKNAVSGIHIISSGTLDATLVHPREVFKAAMLNNSSSIILFHNHPSGDPTPSGEDISMTKRLREAGQILGVEVLDHIIIGDGRFASLKELGFFA